MTSKVKWKVAGLGVGLVIGLALNGFSAAAWAQDTNGTFDGSSAGGPGSGINTPMPPPPPPPPTPPAQPVPNP